MLEEMLIRSRFRELLEKNIDAVGKYRSAIEHTSNNASADQLNRLLKDKQRHVELTERLLEIVE